MYLVALTREDSMIVVVLCSTVCGMLGLTVALLDALKMGIGLLMQD
jgi:hypothetical protein